MSGREYVRSSDLAWVEYDEHTRILRIGFRSDAEYEYLDVPENICNGLMIAPSKGAYLHQYIKERFQCRRVR